MRDPEHEQMPRGQIKELQLERLKHKVKEVYEKVPFYRQAFQNKGVSPDDIKTLKDLTKLLRPTILWDFWRFRRSR